MKKEIFLLCILFFLLMLLPVINNYLDQEIYEEIFLQKKDKILSLKNTGNYCVLEYLEFGVLPKKVFVKNCNIKEN